jgi:hypothetical protein
MASLSASLQSSLTAVWHVGVAYSVGSVVDYAFGKLSKPQTTSMTLLQASGQLAVGFVILSELMALLSDAQNTPIGDGISSAAFIIAQEGLQEKLAQVKAAASPQAQTVSTASLVQQ